MKVRPQAEEFFNELLKQGNSKVMCFFLINVNDLVSVLMLVLKSCEILSEVASCQMKKQAQSCWKWLVRLYFCISEVHFLSEREKLAVHKCTFIF